MCVLVWLAKANPEQSSSLSENAVARGLTPPTYGGMRVCDKRKLGLRKLCTAARAFHSDYAWYNYVTV